MPGNGARDRPGGGKADIEEHHVSAERRATIGGRHPLDRLDAERREYERISGAGQERTRLCDGRPRCQPKSRKAQKLDQQRPDDDIRAAELIGKMTAEQTRDDVTDTECGKTQARTAPTLRLKIKCYESGNGTETDRGERQARTLTPNQPDNAIKWQAGAGHTPRRG
jgi:hypothetical protein